MQTQPDFLIIGGGIIGICISLSLKAAWPEATVHLLEKEAETGRHASGRNSGVLHAGFYYSADSLKARFCREGNAALTAYCRERGLRIRECGKLVVTQDEAELPVLDDLYARGQQNGVVLERITAPEARKIEPRVRTVERALFSPTTSSVDPTEVMASLTADAEQAGVVLERGCRYARGGPGWVETDQGRRTAGYIVNAAGLYADRIAHDFGFGLKYRIVPFKGLYLYSSEPPESLGVHIYPVPDMRYPFLGVHLTVTVEGKAKIGPTAIPALWREQYAGVSGFDAGELREVVGTELGLFLRAGFDFRGLALAEAKKYRRAYLVRQASRLCEGVLPEHYRHWGRPGIRAQLLDLESRKLIMDYCLEGDGRSMHVLNAVSPAFTSAFPFARYVCDEIGKHLNTQ
jgi:L-2-hydroxyglutarate oxidase